MHRWCSLVDTKRLQVQIHDPARQLIMVAQQQGQISTPKSNDKKGIIFFKYLFKYIPTQIFMIILCPKFFVLSAPPQWCFLLVFSYSFFCKDVLTLADNLEDKKEVPFKPVCMAVKNDYFFYYLNIMN